MRLKGKVAIVTGAARGVGAATVQELARQGACVLAVDILQDELESMADTLQSAGYKVSAFAADVGQKADNAHAVDTAISQYGALDIFHANAAVIRFSDIVQTPEAVWDEIHNVNLKGVYLGCQAAIPALAARGGGSVILTASVLGFVGDPELAAYGAAKGGLRALCRSVAVAYGPSRIRCNTVCPGDIRTPMLETFLATRPDPKAALEAMTNAYPTRRLSMPEDVANAVVFLASDESRNITGTDIVIDGGLLASCY